MVDDQQAHLISVARKRLDYRQWGEAEDYIAALLAEIDDLNDVIETLSPNPEPF